MADIINFVAKPKVEYEIRFHHRDATLTMVMMISASSDDEARTKARRMLKGEVRNANIWRAGRLVDSFSTIHKDASASVQSSSRTEPRAARMKDDLGLARKRRVINFKQPNSGSAKKSVG